MTGFDKLALARLALGALLAASSASASAFTGARPAVIGERPQSVGVVLFRVLVRDYLEFRVGSQVTIKSNAGRVVITATNPQARNDAIASTQTTDEPTARETAQPSGQRKKYLMPAAGVVAEPDKTGATNVCLYVEGSRPSCGDLSEVAGLVIYTASNP